MGGQGAALTTTSDALQFNPANLIRVGGVSVSLFGYPFKLGTTTYPFTVGTASLNLGTGTAAGIEYTNLDLHVTPVTSEEYPDGTGEIIHMYERSIAGAFAVALGDNWSVGTSVRYAWWPRINNDKATHALGSVGAAYTPSALAQRLTVGLSLMNFSTPLESPSRNTQGRHYSVPMPAEINLVAEAAVVRERYFDVNASIGFMKPLEEIEEDRGLFARSSFTSLFTAWDNFPTDVTSQFGLGYMWKPLPLGAGVSFFQEMYLGYSTVGTNNSDIEDYMQYYMRVPHVLLYTHGIRAGIEVRGVRASAGYSGRWHTNKKDPILRADFPMETFQIDVSTNWDPLRIGSETEERGQDRLDRILLSTGYAAAFPRGRMKGDEAYMGSQEYSVTGVWSVEADFYLNETSALVASLGYARMTKTFHLDPRIMTFLPVFPLKTNIETVALESGFRYHPLNEFRPFFAQAGFGIMWLNPSPGSDMNRYMYKTFTKVTAGLVLPVGNSGLTVMPMAGLKTLFMENSSNQNTLVAYNQFELGVNVGYTFR